MSSLIVLSTAVAVGLYIPLCIQILSGTVKQNFATWILWMALDGVATGTLIVQHGNYLLPLAYTVGSGVTTLCILKSRNAKWTRFESFVTFLVVVCIVVWMSSGAKLATVASSLALAIAGIPLVIDCYRKPWEIPILIYAGYLLANILSVLGAKDWSIEERFYPSLATIYCFVLVMLALRKFWLKPMSVVT